MMNLVVVYDNYDDGDITYTLCFRHESPEAWLEEFTGKLIQARKDHDADKIARAKWMSEQPNLSKVRGRKKIAEAKASYDSDMKVWHDKMPYFTLGNIVMGTHTFYFWSFYKTYYDNNGGSYSDTPTLPQVYELNEWFEMSVNE